MSKRSVSRSLEFQYATLILPGLLVFTVGIITPMILAFRYSLTEWDGFSRSLPWVGFKNYLRLFSDQNVRSAWLFTLAFTLWNTVIQNVLALAFALALDGTLRLKKFYRTALFLPCLISPVVAGFIWLRLYSDILPTLGALFGLDPGLFRLFGSAKTVLKGLLIANNWQWIGYWSLIYLAGLQSIPTELYEAARVDGASRWGRFINVTVPMLAPAFTICIVGITTGSLKVYDLMVSSTGGGPGRASTSIIYLIYNTALSGRQYGYGSALSMSLVLALLLVAVAQLTVLRKREVQL